jgi:hypothetical protein
MSETKTQLDKFREAARELETDDDESRFDEKLKRLAKVIPEKDHVKNEK